MEYQATTKYIRLSTRKLRLVADSVRKLTPVQAVMYLKQLPKRGGVILAATITSALSNAKQKNVSEEGLMFKHIEVMGGPMMKRFHAVSRGQAHPYKKRMTHVRIVLTDDELKGQKSNESKVHKVKSL